MSERKSIPVEYALISLFVHLPKKVSAIPADTRVLHSAFFRLRDEFALLRDIPFENEYFPYSRFLDYALDNLEMSKLISKVNPSLDTFNLNIEQMKRFYEQNIKNLLINQGIKESKIRKASKKFIEYLREESQKDLSKAA
jgi:hypothetical protein